MGQTNKDWRIKDLHFDKLPNPATFVCWKIRFKDWGMYLFTFSYRNYAMDQRSGDGWICGWCEIFVLWKRNSWAKLWVARRENCFSTEQNHSEYPPQQRGQSGGNESSQRRPLSPRKTDCLLDRRSLPGHWSQWFCRELCRPIYNCSSEWRHSGIRLKVGRNFYFLWWKSHLMISRKDCTN